MSYFYFSIIKYIYSVVFMTLIWVFSVGLTSVLQPLHVMCPAALYLRPTQLNWWEWSIICIISLGSSYVYIWNEERATTISVACLYHVFFPCIVYLYFLLLFQFIWTGRIKKKKKYTAKGEFCMSLPPSDYERIWTFPFYKIILFLLLFTLRSLRFPHYIWTHYLASNRSLLPLLQYKSLLM